MTPTSIHSLVGEPTPDSTNSGEGRLGHMSYLFIDKNVNQWIMLVSLVTEVTVGMVVTLVTVVKVVTALATIVDNNVMY